MYSVEEFFKKKGIKNLNNTLNEKTSESSNIVSNKSSFENKNVEKQNYIDEDLAEIQRLQEFDKMKSKVLKYALYKKRTEQEIRQKFSKELEENMLDDIIEVLKENSYIDDFNYIERTVNEFINLKKLSIKEVKYKLYSKGIKSSLIDEYISKNKDRLNEYEENSAYKIVCKKQNNMEEDEIKLYLLKKGYKEESIQQALHGGE